MHDALHARVSSAQDHAPARGRGFDPHDPAVLGIRAAAHETLAREDADGLRHRGRADALPPRKCADGRRPTEDDRGQHRLVLRRQARPKAAQRAAQMYGRGVEATCEIMAILHPVK